jgi:hypothetical protein
MSTVNSANEKASEWRPKRTQTIPREEAYMFTVQVRLSWSELASVVDVNVFSSTSLLFAEFP